VRGGGRGLLRYLVDEERYMWFQLLKVLIRRFLKWA